MVPKSTVGNEEAREAGQVWRDDFWLQQNVLHESTGG